MKILVTGAAGYVGSVLVPALLARGHEVIALDNLMYGSLTMLPHFLDRRFHFVKGDVRDEGAVREAVRTADAVVHLAAIVGYPACRRQPDLARDVNVGGTTRLARALSPQQLLVFASTGSNYGRVEGVCTEESPLEPISLYGVTKTEGEKISRDVGALVLRLATAFGLSPRLRLDLLVNAFVHQALTKKHLSVYEGSFRRSFVHVHDIARAVLFALDHQDVMRAQVWNVGHESMNATKAQIALKIRERIPFHLDFAEVGHDEDQRDYEVSYRKIAALGLALEIDLDRGIDELISGLRTIDIADPFSNAPSS